MVTYAFPGCAGYAKLLELLEFDGYPELTGSIGFVEGAVLGSSDTTAGLALYLDKTLFKASKKLLHLKTFTSFSIFLGLGFSIAISELNNRPRVDRATVLGFKNCKFRRIRLFSSTGNGSPTNDSSTSKMSTDVTTIKSFSAHRMHEMIKSLLFLSTQSGATVSNLMLKVVKFSRVTLSETSLRSCSNSCALQFSSTRSKLSSVFKRIGTLIVSKFFLIYSGESRLVRIRVGGPGSAKVIKLRSIVVARADYGSTRFPGQKKRKKVMFQIIYCQSLLKVYEENV